MMTLRPVLSRSTQLASSVVTGRVEMYSEQDTGRADDRLDYMYVLVKGIDGCGCCVVVLLAAFSTARSGWALNGPEDWEHTQAIFSDKLKQCFDFSQCFAPEPFAGCPALLESTCWCIQDHR